MDLNRVIGYQGKIPWHLSADLNFFKKITSDKKTGGALLMGSRTFSTLPKSILLDRYIYVLSNHIYAEYPTHRFLSENDFNKLTAEKDTSKIWVCGGASVYKKFLPSCIHVYVTIVLNEYEGDTFLDPFEDKFPYQELLLEAKTHWIVKYSKI